MSQDGFIAGDGGDISFLNDYHVEGEDYGYTEFLDSVDSIIVGRRTYDKVLSMGFPYHEDKHVFVITRQTDRKNDKGLTFYRGNLATLVRDLKTKGLGNLYCDGGAQLAHHMIDLKLIDRIVLSVIPKNLHSGTRLFPNGTASRDFKLVQTKPYPTGLVQRTYDYSPTLD